MEDAGFAVVTGAFGYTGKYITKRLLSAGKRVKTITGHPTRPSPFEEEIEVHPFLFDDLGGLTRSLRGAETLFNTYWIRFPHRGLTYERAVENSRTLIRAAEEAGVRRIVHISIANAEGDSPFPYYRGKAEVEDAIRGSSLSYAIIRPTVLFGYEGILINNIAWFLRRFPVFIVPGRGEYRIQPVHVEDVAELAVRSAQHDDNSVMDAAGPEVYTYNELVRTIRDEVGSKAGIIHFGGGLAFCIAKMLNAVTGDVVITRDEIEGLAADLLISRGQPAGRIRLSDWLLNNSDRLGQEYYSELDRHYR